MKTQTAEDAKYGVWLPDRPGAGRAWGHHQHGRAVVVALAVEEFG